MRTIRAFFLTCLLGFAAPGIPAAQAQDAAVVQPRAYRVAFENDKLRVLDGLAGASSAAASSPSCDR